MAAINEPSSSLHVSSWMIPIAVVAVALLLIQRFLTPQRDAREPPFLPSKIPVVGHLYHLIREGADYYSRLESRHHQGIYTLPILNGRMYMVTSPEWAAAIHRVHKSLQFNTLIATAMQKLFCMDDAAMEIINVNLNGENGKREGIMLEIHDMMGATLAPGPLLDDLNKKILNKIAPDFNQLAKEGPVQIKLWQWLRHHFSIASVSAVWGPRNPFTLYPDIEPAFWEFEANSMPLTMMPFPHLLAKRGYNSRQRLFDAWEEYVKNEDYNQPETSQLIKNRVRINMGKFELSKRMFANGECSLLFGTLLNTIPIAFWLLSWIFEDRELLIEIRAEVDRCVLPSPANKTKHIVNATQLRTSCPLFNSAFRETLRLVGSLNSNRWVAEDTTVTNNATGETYLLKKGTVVQIAGNVIHFRSFWGSETASFNPRRFMAPKAEASSSGKIPDPAAPFRDPEGKIHSSAFRSFGGGNNVCPGRHFAQTEVLALVALFVAGFEIENVGGNDGYKMPPYEDYKLMMGVIKPGRDVEVNVSRRKGYENVEWEFAM